MRQGPYIAALLVLLSGFFLAPPASAVELLGPAPVLVPELPSPWDIAAGDFNEDGALDMVVAVGAYNPNAPTQNVLLNDRQGGFLRKYAFSGWEYGMRVVAADFDLDGHLDIVRAPSSSVNIMLGDGAGGFSQHTGLQMYGSVRSIATGDFNADGAVDLAVASVGSVRVALNNGEGYFRDISDLTVGGGNSIASGDLNGDGALDLVLAHGTTMSVYIGDGSGGFTPGSEIGAGEYPRSIRIADFDADGRLDLAVADYDGGTVSTLQGDGLGGFTPKSNIAVGENPASIAVADLNGDDAQDLVVASEGSDIVSVILGDGRGGFARTSDIGVGSEPGSVVIGDFSLDGAMDIAVACADEEYLIVLPGDGLGGFGPQPFQVGVGEFPRGVTAADFNSDGALDLAATEAQDDSVSILIGDGQRGFTPWDRVDVGSRPEAITAGDFNADGALDLAVANRGLPNDGVPDSVSILLGDGSGSFTRASDVETGDSPRSVVTGDFNGDGAPDLATADEYGDSVSIFLGDGTGGFTRSSQIDLLQPRQLAIGDFNEDGALDLAVAHYSYGTILEGDGLGGFQLASEIPLGHYTTSIAVADLNGDGALDIAATITNAVLTFLGDGLGGFTPGGTVQLSGALHAIAVGDFNADSALDLVVSRVPQSCVSVLTGDGLGDFARASDIAVDGYESIAVGDFDADGMTDLAIPNHRIDTVDIFYGQIIMRADVNGSNRIDGFDVAAVGRLFGLERCDECTESPYRRGVDVNLDGIIDGDDLALVASRFGELNKEASPLRPRLEGALPVGPDSVTLQAGNPEGDLLAVQVMVNDSDDLSSAADFAVTFDPVDPAHGQVLDFAGFSPGTYFAGGTAQVYAVDASTPGRANIAVSRFPTRDQRNPGLQPLMELLLRGRREGQATLGFAPYQHDRATFLDEEAREVPGVAFTGSGLLTVDAAAGGPPGQKIGSSPDSVDFGQVEMGASARRTLRIVNFGYSSLRVSSIASSLPEFSFLYSSEAFPFTVPPYGFVELGLVFEPTRTGVFAGDLTIESDDPGRPEIHVSLLGGSDIALAVMPHRLDFGRGTLVGDSRDRVVGLYNRGEASLALTSVRSSNFQFAPHAGFSVLAPGEYGQVNVRFQPQVAGEFLETLTLGFDAPGDRTVVVGLVATAEQDTDLDGLLDRLDNCPDVSNIDQIDVDSDGVGDACDGCLYDPNNDIDDDAVCGDVDNCPYDFNPDQANRDGDFLADACDPYPDHALNIKRLGPYTAWIGDPLTITFQLQNMEGAVISDLTGIRAALTLDGSAVFGTFATEGLLIEGGGTNNVVVEFVEGVVALEVNDPVAEIVNLGIEDVDEIGIASARGGADEDFELDDGGFIADGVTDGWEWGVPTYGPSSAVSGERVWATNLDGPYPIADTSLIIMTLTTPDYPLPEGAAHLALEFQSWFESEEIYDPGYVDLSIDGGVSWVGLDNFQGAQSGYTLQSYDLPYTYEDLAIRFRFRLTSDIVISFAGWYIDDFVFSYDWNRIEFREPPP